MKFRMKRVLCITANMNAGGAETFLMKIYRRLDTSKYQMDFCVSAEKNVYEEEIIKRGGKVYKTPMKSRHPLKAFLSIKEIVSDYNYQYVMRINEHSLSVIDLIAARMGGASRLIMRSSNSASGGTLPTVLHKLCRFLPESIPDVKIAPSLLAAEYTFGKKNVKNNQVHILNNGLDTSRFAFSKEWRDEIRAEYNISDKLVIGHVGRFNQQKNHQFLIDIFNEVQKKNKNAVLMLVGEGVLLEEIQAKVSDLGILDKCIFTGLREDVNQLLSAMDLFLFPSLYEGMPNTVIEAQTSGLACLISDSITKEANVINRVEYMSLDRTPYEWADKLLSMHSTDRSKAYTDMNEQGYSIESVVEEFVKIVYES